MLPKFTTPAPATTSSPSSVGAVPSASEGRSTTTARTTATSKARPISAHFQDSPLSSERSPFVDVQRPRSASLDNLKTLGRRASGSSTPATPAGWKGTPAASSAGWTPMDTPLETPAAPTGTEPRAVEMRTSGHQPLAAFPADSMRPQGPPEHFQPGRLVQLADVGKPPSPALLPLVAPTLLSTVRGTPVSLSQLSAHHFTAGRPGPHEVSLTDAKRLIGERWAEVSVCDVLDVLIKQPGEQGPKWEAQCRQLGEHQLHSVCDLQKRLGHPHNPQQVAGRLAEDAIMAGNSPRAVKLAYPLTEAQRKEVDRIHIAYLQSQRDDFPLADPALLNEAVRHLLANPTQGVAEVALKRSITHLTDVAHLKQAVLHEAMLLARRGETGAKVGPNDLALGDELAGRMLGPGMIHAWPPLGMGLQHMVEELNATPPSVFSKSAFLEEDLLLLIEAGVHPAEALYLRAMSLDRTEDIPLASAELLNVAEQNVQHAFLGRYFLSANPHAQAVHANIQAVYAGKDNPDYSAQYALHTAAAVEAQERLLRLNEGRMPPGIDTMAQLEAQLQSPSYRADIALAKEAIDNGGHALYAARALGLPLMSVASELWPYENQRSVMWGPRNPKAFIAAVGQLNKMPFESVLLHSRLKHPQDIAGLRGVYLGLQVRASAQSGSAGSASGDPFAQQLTARLEPLTQEAALLDSLSPLQRENFERRLRDHPAAEPDIRPVQTLLERRQALLDRMPQHIMEARNWSPSDHERDMASIAREWASLDADTLLEQHKQWADQRPKPDGLQPVG